MSAFKKKCLYCESDLPLMSDVCTYCGQKQKAEHDYSKAFGATENSVTQTAKSPRSTEQPKRSYSPAQTAAPTARSAEELRQQLKRIAQGNAIAVKRAEAEAALRKSQQKAAGATGTPLIFYAFRLITFIAWTATFFHMTHHYRGQQHYGDIPWDGVGISVLIPAFLFMIFSRRSIVLSFIAANGMFVSALLLLTKPKVAPITYSYQDYQGTMQTIIFPYMSETHSYYVLPGMILMFLSVIVGIQTLKRFFSAFLGLFRK